MSMTFLECIFGIHPVLALIESNEVDSIYHCIENTDFYDYLINSPIYQEHYQDDEEFAVVEAFIKLGLSRDLKKREEGDIDYDGDVEEAIMVDKEALKSELAKFYNFE